MKAASAIMLTLSLMLAGCCVPVHYSSLAYIRAGQAALYSEEVDTYDRIVWCMKSEVDLEHLARREHVALGCEAVLMRDGVAVASYMGYVVPTGRRSADDGMWMFRGVVRFGSGLTVDRLRAQDYDDVCISVMLLYMVGPGWYSFSKWRLTREEVLLAVMASPAPSKSIE